MMKTVLKSKFSGSWYPGDRNVLCADIENYLKNAKVDLLQDVQALILPHAGYAYSGQTAAYGIKQVLAKSYRRVIIIGPSHWKPLGNTISVPSVQFYSTPLGEVELDIDCIQQLLTSDLVACVPEAHENEHSVQMEIPLLQFALKSFKLVPLLVGQLDETSIERLAQLLQAWADFDTLLVISSDFTHYGHRFAYRPFGEPIAENLHRLDMKVYDYIRNQDKKGFLQYISRTKATVCGRIPIAILLAMLPAESSSHLLHYDTSGNLTGDFENSVSYMSIAFTGHWEQKISEEDEKILLNLVLKTLAFYFQNQRAPRPHDLEMDITPAMQSSAGVFVTLRKENELRGCVGELNPQKNIYETVIKNAIRAAFQDTRFSSVKAEELSSLQIEISILSILKPVSTHEEIEIGKHGILLSKKGCSAVFLPEVAVEHNWDLETTLNFLSRKAGLPEKGWRKGAEFKVFETQVFHNSLS